MKAVLCGLVIAVGACGDSKAGPDAYVPTCQVAGGSACFQLPTDIMQTRDGSASALSCAAYTPVDVASAVTFMGTVMKYGVTVAVPGAQIAIATSPSLASPVATATAAADGTYTLTLPAGTPNVVFTQLVAPGFLETRVYNFAFDSTKTSFPMFNPRIVTSDNVESAALLVKEIWDPTKAFFAGTVIDCNGVIVEHAEVVVSSTSGSRTFVDGVSVYYGAPGAVPLAVPPDQRGDTNDNGAFALFHIPPDTPLYTQVWGFVDASAMAQGADGLVLIGEYPISPPANTATSISAFVHHP